MTVNKVPQAELAARITRFTSAMDEYSPGWEMCAIVGDVNMFYLTGTICDGVLLISRAANSATLWVRRSYERAVLESEFGDIRPMGSFRDIAGASGDLPGTLYLDMSAATLEWYGLFSKYMKFAAVLPLDKIMLRVRSVKSDYELSIMRRAGEIIDGLLCNDFPRLLRPGMSEAELGGELFSLLVKNGYHGVSRFSMRNADVIMGHICFGEGSLYPSVFNGASGLVGLSPGTPVLGSRQSHLNAGNLIYIDVDFGIDGYNTDRTVIYSYKNPQPDFVNAAHAHCLELERMAADMLLPGAIPAEIYSTVLEQVRPEYRDCFMGAPGRPVPFLGHSVGLYGDETPVIAKGFNDPLERGMTMAIEPKIGIAGHGMVGSENTYLITESGPVSLTGGRLDIIVCP